MKKGQVISETKRPRGLERVKSKDFDLHLMMRSSLMTQCVNGTYVVLFYNNWALRLLFTTSLGHPVRHTFMQALFFYTWAFCLTFAHRQMDQGQLRDQCLAKGYINMPSGGFKPSTFQLIDNPLYCLTPWVTASCLKKTLLKKYDNNLVCTFFFHCSPSHNIP